MSQEGARTKRSSNEILRDILAEHYDLGQVGLPHPFPGAHQRRHRKLVVEAEKGKFVAKTYSNEEIGLDSLRFQHRLSDHLERNGIPIARIYPAKNGKRIVELDTWALELQQFCPGKPMPITQQTLITSGSALGRLHVVCRDVPRPRRDVRMWRFSEVPREIFSRLYQMALDHGESGAVNRACNRIALFLRDAADALSIEKRRHFETGLIHGDWHSGNLLFIGERLSAVLDLEFAGEGCYLEDLAYAISNLCVRTSTEFERLDKRTDLLVDHYQIMRSLSILEELAMYYAVGVKHIATVSYQMRSAEEVAGMGPAEWMATLSRQCDWLDERARRVRHGH